MGRIFFVYGLGTLGVNGSMSWCPVESEYVLAGFKQAGAIVMEEREFVLFAHRDKGVRSDDMVVNYFVSSENVHLVVSVVAPANRWTYIIDTKVKPDKTGAYAGSINRCMQHDIQNAIITYENPEWAQELHKHRVRTVHMPQCVPSRRRRVQKTGNVLLSGTFIPHVYPTRGRLKTLFETSIPHLTTSIARDAYPTHATGRPRESLVRPTGAAYYDILDRYQIAVTCKMDVCDIVVAKYAEFGMCHVLPVGDCPTYLPQPMKDAMLNVEGMSDHQVIVEVNRLLGSPDELLQRQEAYMSATHVVYDLRTNVDRVLRELLSPIVV